MSDEYKANLWALAASWDCDAVGVATQRAKSGVSVLKKHALHCRKCALQKHLLRIDEMLKSVEEMDEDALAEKLGYGLALDAAQATQDHAKFVREEFIGASE